MKKVIVLLSILIAYIIGIFSSIIFMINNLQIENITNLNTNLNNGMVTIKVFDQYINYYYEK